MAALFHEAGQAPRLQFVAPPRNSERHADAVVEDDVRAPTARRVKAHRRDTRTTSVLQATMFASQRAHESIQIASRYGEPDAARVGQMRDAITFNLIHLDALAEEKVPSFRAAGGASWPDRG